MDLPYPSKLFILFLLALTSAMVGLPMDTDNVGAEDRRLVENDPALQGGGDALNQISEAKDDENTDDSQTLQTHTADSRLPDVKLVEDITSDDQSENAVTEHKSESVVFERLPSQPSFSCSPTYTINVEPSQCQCESDSTLEELKVQVEQLKIEVEYLKIGRDYQRNDGPIPGGEKHMDKPKDCADLMKKGHTESGVYVVHPKDDKKPFEVYCDMETDGGGWTMFQRRRDGSVNFYRDWDAYKYGFGELKGEFWLGNEKIHRLTIQDKYDLRIDLGDTAGKFAYAEYDNFGVASEAVVYKLSLGDYSGDAGDSFGTERHRNMKFSTRDTDNDVYEGHCARIYKGGWWYGACHHTNLNGLYHHGDNPDESADGISWEAWRGYHYSLKYTI
ncbi:techylectin-5A-like [Ptychodera flava]|uniref:techylectin-5A-like n=1 Tax=Ptychodera flava TaxID=63121 RepID=UPI00396A8B93